MHRSRTHVPFSCLSGPVFSVWRHWALAAGSESEPESESESESLLLVMTASLERSELYVFVWIECAPQSLPTSPPRPTWSFRFLVQICFTIPLFSRPRPWPSAQPIFETSL